MYTIGRSSLYHNGICDHQAVGSSANVDLIAEELESPGTRAFTSICDGHRNFADIK